MPQDEIKIDILPDGTIRFETDAISPASHHNAEEFLKFIEQMSGGATEIKRKHGHVHTHKHEHLHTHAKE